VQRGKPRCAVPRIRAHPDASGAVSGSAHRAAGFFSSPAPSLDLARPTTAAVRTVSPERLTDPFGHLRQTLNQTPGPASDPLQQGEPCRRRSVAKPSQNRFRRITFLGSDCPRSPREAFRNVATKALARFRSHRIRRSFRRNAADPVDQILPPKAENPTIPKGWRRGGQPRPSEPTTKTCRATQAVDARP